MNPDSQEPPDGDFVAYLESLERRQLAALKLEHRLPDVDARTSPDDSDPGDAQARTPPRADAESSTHRPQAKAATTPLPAGIVVALVIGVVLLASSLLGEGGLVMFAIGAALLAHAVNRLLRFRRNAPDARQQALQRVTALIDSARKR